MQKQTTPRTHGAARLTRTARVGCSHTLAAVLPPTRVTRLVRRRRRPPAGAVAHLWIPATPVDSSERRVAGSAESTSPSSLPLCPSVRLRLGPGTESARRSGAPPPSLPLLMGESSQGAPPRQDGEGHGLRAVGDAGLPLLLHDANNASGSWRSVSGDGGAARAVWQCLELLC